jgi:hypothetical protein
LAVTNFIKGLIFLKHAVDSPAIASCIAIKDKIGSNKRKICRAAFGAYECLCKVRKMILAIVIYNRLKSLGQNFLVELHTGAFRKILNFIPVVTSYKGITDTFVKSIKIYSNLWNNQVFQKTQGDAQRSILCRSAEEILRRGFLYMHAPFSCTALL